MSGSTIPRRIAPRGNVPLDSRGWTFQERFMARRSIRYEPEQVVFECQTAGYLEKFPSDVLSARDLSLSDISRFGIGGWHSAIRNFTLRNLTFPQDRAAAISGLANRYSETLNSYYVAGLWRDSFISHLRWSLYDVSTSNQNFGRGHAISGSPSWSWWSINLPVHWDTWIAQLSDDRFTEIKILNITAKPSGRNAFGPVEYPAPLALEAKLIHGRLRYQQPSLYLDEERKYRCKLQYKGERFSLNVHMDCSLARTPVATATNMSVQSSGSNNQTFRWSKNNPDRVGELARNGEEHPIKIFHVEPTSRDGESYSRGMSFGLVLSFMGRDAAGQDCFERIGHVIIGDDDSRTHALLSQAKPTVFCII